MSNGVALYSVDVSDPRLVYEPAKAWGHFCTQTAGSSVTFKFNGWPRDIVHRTPPDTNIEYHAQVPTLSSTGRPLRQRRAYPSFSIISRYPTIRVQETRRTHPSTLLRRPSTTACIFSPSLQKAQIRRFAFTSYNILALRTPHLQLAHSHSITLPPRLPQSIFLPARWAES